jgi:hypothetical protein
MILMLLGSVILVSDVQSEKADAPILVTLSGIARSANNSHPEKLPSSISVTLLEMMICASIAHLQKALASITVTVSGKDTV